MDSSEILGKINKNVDECIKVVEEKIFDNMTADESFFDREE